MKKASMKRGWTPFAHDLTDKLSHAGLSAKAILLVLQIAKRSYGRGRKAFAVVDTNDLAESLHVTAQTVRRILRTLIAANIIATFKAEKRLRDGERCVGIQADDIDRWRYKAAVADERNRGMPLFAAGKARGKPVGKSPDGSSSARPVGASDGASAPFCARPVGASSRRNTPSSNDLRFRKKYYEEDEEVTTTTMRASRAEVPDDRKRVVVDQLLKIFGDEGRARANRLAPKIAAALGDDTERVVERLVREAAKAKDGPAFLGRAIDMGLKDGSGWDWKVRPRKLTSEERWAIEVEGAAEVTT